MAFEDGQVLISGLVSEDVALNSKMAFVDVDKFKDLEMGKFTWDYPLGP